MKNKPIKLKKIRLKELHTFSLKALLDATYNQVLPISPHRALSQTNNPYGHPDDIALLIAFVNNRCVGYLGLMPGLIAHNGHYLKIFYMTTFFVLPDYRGVGIGNMLLYESKRLKVDILLIGMAQSARQAFDRAGFKRLGKLVYYQLQVNRLHYLSSFLENSFKFMANKAPKLLKLSLIMNRVETFTYFISKKIYYRFVLNQARKEKKDFTYTMVKKISDSSFSFSSHSKFYRGIEAVNWMLKYQWILSAHEEKRPLDNYYFSSARDIFKYIAVEIYSSDRKSFKGFMVLSISRRRSNTMIKLLDCCFKELTDIDIAGFILLKYAQNFLADRVEIPTRLKNYFGRQACLKYLIKKKKRLYMFHPKGEDSPLKTALESIELSYCDSDIPFI